jgi:5,10-methenyltetrahydromethanopterin hydrogenase
MNKKMKISAIYYLADHAGKPEDIYDAQSEVYVEVGGEDASLDHFDYTYSFEVYTLKALERELQQTDGAVIHRSIIIVDQFKIEKINTAIESILPQINAYGTNKDG